MARTGFFHHIGTFLIFSAAILLLITTISAPVVNDIGILKVTLSGTGSNGKHSSVRFGTFGYCILDVAGDNSGQDFCTGKHIGYNPATVMEALDSTDFNLASEDTTKALTRVMVLHPIATGLAFIAFLISAGSGFIGALGAAFLSTLTFVICLVVLITDFVLFALIKRHVNDDGSGSHAEFSTGIWTLLVAMLCLLFGTIIVLFTCCSSRLHRQDRPKSEYVSNGTTTKRHFWQRRNRY